MRTHLSDHELAAWQAGECSPQSASHMAECGDCRRGASRLEDALGLFGETARTWSSERLAAHKAHMVVDPARGRGSMRQHGWVWTAAVAMMLLIAGLTTWMQEQHAAQQAAQQRQLASDTVLLQEIDEDVSQVVPEALAPLGQSGVANEINNTAQQ